MPQPPKPITEKARQAVDDLLDDPVPPPQDGDDYVLGDSVAEAPLAGSEVADLVDEILVLVEQAELVFPDARGLVEQAVVGLLAGNLVLHGPPGTGKTRLASLLAQGFNCSAAIETGTPDWSTFDVIGGLRPGRDEQGAEVLVPWLGHIPRAALQCAAAVSASLDGGAGPQAHWLIVDELSRADIDKAIGPAYTALGASTAATRKIGLWFEDAPQRATVTLPERFRVIGTMNDVDTAFVTQLSQGLQRRFDFVHVDVPAADQTETELTQVTRQAAATYGRLYGGITEGGMEKWVDEVVAEERIGDVIKLLRDLVDFLRWAPDGPRWPVGSAQLGEVIRSVVIRAKGDPGLSDLTTAVDRALASSVIRQTSALTEAQLEAIEARLAGLPLPRSLRAIAIVREPQLTHP